MRNWLGLLIMLFAMEVPVRSQRITEEIMVKRDLLAMIDVHPDDKLRQDLKRWHVQGKFRIVVNSNIPGLACGLGGDIAKPNVQWPVLLVSARFFSTTHLRDALLEDPDNFRMEKFGQLYHEFIHLSAHLSGKHPLNFLKHAPVDQAAKYSWEWELEAYLEEWRFLKRLGYARVFINPEFDKLGEWEQFIRTVYHLQQLHPNYRQYRAYWDELFRGALNHPRF